MSDHSFNPFIAQKYSINIAILINTAIFWTRTNAAKPIGKQNYHENRYWFYGTPEYFKQFFPYFTEKQIKYALSKCIELGLLIKGKFNKKGYDQTNWYALSDQALIELNLDYTCLKPFAGLIGQNCPMDRTKLSNGSDKIVRPIPDTKPDTKPDKNIYISEPEKIEPEPLKPIDYEETYYKQHNDKVEQVIQNKSFELFWKKYPIKKNKARAQCAWESQECHKIWEQILQKLTLQLAEDQQYIDGYAPSPANYIMQERWKDEIQKKVHKKTKQSHHHTDWDVNLHQDII